MKRTQYTPKELLSYPFGGKWRDDFNSNAAVQLFKDTFNAAKRRDEWNRIADDCYMLEQRDPGSHGESFFSLFHSKSVMTLAAIRGAQALDKVLPALALPINRLMIHSITAADISLSAQFGRGVVLDHTHATRIGGTAEIGDAVYILGGTTLGNNGNFKASNGRRHPIIQDGAILYSYAKVLGVVTVGYGAVIGADATATHDVPPFAVVINRNKVSRFQHPFTGAPISFEDAGIARSPGEKTIDVRDPRLWDGSKRLQEQFAAEGLDIENYFESLATYYDK